jgi:hypothetical protein
MSVGFTWILPQTGVSRNDRQILGGMGRFEGLWMSIFARAVHLYFTWATQFFCRGTSPFWGHGSGIRRIGTGDTFSRLQNAWQSVN